MAEQICIDSTILGTEKHLVVDDGYTWSADVPPSAWHFSGEVKLHCDRCFDTAIKLAGAVVDTNPPEKFTKSMKTTLNGRTTSIPWMMIMPEREHRAFVKKIVNSSIEALGKILKNYYVNTWVPESAILRSLKPAKVNESHIRLIKSQPETRNAAIETFRPGVSGFCPTVDYDRFGTRTGRLLVNSGPDILTLKREYRNIIVPSEPRGRIAYVDFSALEARVLLYESGGSCPDVDLYTFISNELFSGTAPRNACKKAVISELYGSGKYAIGKELGIEGKQLDDFVNKIKSFFRTKELLKRVKAEYVKTGKVINRYGRRLVIDDPVDNIFVNTYAQSTGVDVCLLGFSQIAQSLSETRVRPLFVLHDALLLDVPEESVETVSAISEVRVPGYEQAFPVKCEFIE